MGKEKYEAFHEALEAATVKVDEYYTKTAASDAHIIAMGIWSLFFTSHLLIYNHIVLHPQKKMLHFKKYWSNALQADVLELLEAKVCFLSHFYNLFTV